MTETQHSPEQLDLFGSLELEEIFVALEPQARTVLLDIARRLKAGQVEYGRLSVFTDRRDFFEEAAEEAMDFCVYAAMDRLRRTRA